MKKEVQKWHLDVIAHHRAKLYDTLIHKHNVISECIKGIRLRDEDDIQLAIIKGVFAIKDEKLWLIPESLKNELPLRISSHRNYYYRDNVVFYPAENSISIFRIKPEKTMEVRDFVDDFVPFEHTNPKGWIVMKFLVLAGFIGKTFVCIATQPNFGKTTSFDALNGITDKCPVFKPRSVPGVLNQITGDGNIVFDEVFDCTKEVKRIIEEFCLNVGGNKNTYVNGAMKSGQTKEKYDCERQSITHLYNITSSYKNPEEDYFDFAFTNNKAIDDRFLKLVIYGELTEKFDRQFSIPKTAEENFGYYMKFGKMVLFLQEVKKNEAYTLKWKQPEIKLNGRKTQIYKEITWLIDMYCNNQEEFDEYVSLLNKAIFDYKGMILRLGSGQNPIAQYTEEKVK